MPQNQSETFERIRDGFFFDPRHPDTSQLADACVVVATGLAGDSYQTDTPSPLVDAAQQLTDLYTGPDGARVFDHLSAGQLHPAGNVLAAVGHLMAAVYNNNTIISEVSPVGSRLEQEAIGWALSDLAGYDREYGSGALVTGGTSANLTALTVAREKLATKEGWNGRTDEPALLLASDMVHYSIGKSAAILGPFGMIDLQRVAREHGGYRMDPADVEARIKEARRLGRPIMGIVAVAGETETGLIDDLGTLAEIADEYDVQLHVDGAYGAPFRLSRAGKLMDGIEQSDSLTFDPHKYLYAPYPAGGILFRSAADHQLLKGLNRDGGTYMWQDDPESMRAAAQDARLGRARLEGSMGEHAAIVMHLIGKHFGNEGIAALLDHTLDLSEAFADEFRNPGDDGLRLSYEPELNSICLQPPDKLAGTHAGNKRVEELCRTLDTDYGVYLSTTALPYTTDETGAATTKVLRFVPTHPHTTIDDATTIARDIKSIWGK